MTRKSSLTRAVLCLALAEGPWFGLGRYDLLGGEEASGLARDLTYLLPFNTSNDTFEGACEIPSKSGHMVGVCATRSDMAERLSFCRDSVQYRACIPSHQPLWETWEVTQKDAMLAALYKDMVEARLAAEMNVTPDVYVEIHFLSNPQCLMALKNTLCWYNFPKCSDDNVSLPLCQSSCEQYYTKCRYQPNMTDGLHDKCKAKNVRKNGIFNSGMASADQVLAENNKVCGSTEEEADSIAVEGASDTPFIQTPAGMLTYGAIFVAVVGCAYFLLVPGPIRAYAHWVLIGIILIPRKVWRSLPIFKGRTLTCCLVFVFVILLALGLYRRIMPGVGMDRFNVTYSNNTTAEEFIPVQAVYKVDAKRSLTNTQLKQLVGSCSCTGSALQSATPRCSVLVLVTAFVLCLTKSSW